MKEVLANTAKFSSEKKWLKAVFGAFNQTPKAGVCVCLGNKSKNNKKKETGEQKLNKKIKTASPNLLFT